MCEVFFCVIYNFGQNFWDFFFKEIVLLEMLETPGLDLDLCDRL